MSTRIGDSFYISTVGQLKANLGHVFVELNGDNEGRYTCLVFKERALVSQKCPSLVEEHKHGNELVDIAVKGYRKYTVSPYGPS
jgi:hypothetical protein